jgi:PIN domain nuclease of toxin-antitoxin system
VLCWWSVPRRLATRVLTLIKDPATTIVVSAASAWEVATKHGIGKLPDGGRLALEWAERLRIDAFTELAITSQHALRAGAIPSDHRDLFDRMIAAQSILDGRPVASIDHALSDLGAERVWGLAPVAPDGRGVPAGRRRGVVG